MFYVETYAFEFSFKKSRFKLICVHLDPKRVVIQFGANLNVGGDSKSFPVPRR